MGIDESSFYIKKFINSYLIAHSKLSRIFANAAAKLNPKCDCATSTISSNIVTGTLLSLKWTETAMYAL